MIAAESGSMGSSFPRNRRVIKLTANRYHPHDDSTGMRMAFHFRRTKTMLGQNVACRETPQAAPSAVETPPRQRKGQRGQPRN